MKLSCVLVACNEKTQYLEFWPSVKRAWLEVAKLPCIMVYVGEILPNGLHGDPAVRWFKPIAGWPTATQAQCIRLFYPALLETDGAVMISDMDMIPLQGDWFVNGFKQFEENQFVSLRGIDDEAKQIYMCYVGAIPKVWGEMFGITCEQDIRNRLTEWSQAHKSDGLRPVEPGRPYIGWATDQLELYRHVKAWDPRRIGLLPFTAEFNRLCRSKPNEWMAMSKDLKLRLKERYYIDFHMPSYTDFSNQIDMIVIACGKILQK